MVCSTGLGLGLEVALFLENNALKPMKGTKVQTLSVVHTLYIP